MQRARTVLVVDDDKRVCEVVGEFLKDYGCEVLCANDGAEALALLGDAPQIAVAVVDLLLPGSISGEDVAERASGYGVKVITMSGKLASDSRGRDLRTPHLGKPFKMAQLRSAIDRVLGAG